MLALAKVGIEVINYAKWMLNFPTLTLYLRLLQTFAGVHQKKNSYVCCF